MTQSMRVIMHMDMDCYYAQVERERFPDWIDCPVAVVQKKRLCVAVNYGVRMRGSKKIGQATLLAQLIPQTKFAGSQMKRYRTGYRRWRTVVDAFAGGLSDCTVEKKSIDECLIDLTFICRQRLLMRVVPHPFAASLDKHFEARREQARERIRADPTGVLQREQTGNLRVAQEMSRTTDPLEEQDGVRLSDPVPLPFDRSKLTVAALEGQGLSAKNAATILSAFALEASMPAAEFTAMVGRTHPQRYCRARVGEVGWNACSRLTRDDLRAIVSGARGGRGEEAEAEKDGASLGQAPVWAGKVLLCDSDADEDADEDDGEGGEGCGEGADQEAEEGSGEEEKGEAGEVAQRRIVSSRRRRRKYEWEVEDDVVAAAISDASAPAAADAGATVPDLRGKRRSMEGAVKGEEDEGQAAETGQGKARPRLDAVPPAAPSSSSSSCSSSSSSSSSSSASLVQLTLPNPSTTCVGSGSGSGRAPSLRYLISPFVCRGCFGWRLPWTRQAGACGEALRARSKALPLAAIIDDLVPEECECADRTVVAAGSADRAAHLLAGSAAAREKHHAGGAPAALAPAPAPAPAAGGSGGDRQGGGLSAASEPAYDPRLHTLLIALGSQLALEIRQRIFLSEGFTTACGVAPNAMVAKLASQEHKPNQQTVVLPALVRPFMRRQRLCDVPMFGPASQALAARYGLYSVKQVQDLGREGLRKQFSGPPPSLASGGGGGATEAKAGEAAHPQHQQKQEEEIEEVDDDADDDDGGGGGGGGGRHRDEHLDDLTGFADSLWRIGEGINTSPIQPRDIPKVLGRSSNRRIATDEQRRAMVLWLAEQVLIRVEDDINDNKRKPKTLVLGGYFASMPTFDPPPAPGVVLGGRKRHALGRSWQRRCLLVSLRGDDAPDPALPSSLDAAATADAAAGTVAAGTAKRETEDPREAAIRALRKSIPRTAIKLLDENIPRNCSDLLLGVSLSATNFVPIAPTTLGVAAMFARAGAAGGSTGGGPATTHASDGPWAADPDLVVTGGGAGAGASGGASPHASPAERGVGLRSASKVPLSSASASASSSATTSTSTSSAVFAADSLGKMAEDAFESPTLHTGVGEGSARRRALYAVGAGRGKPASARNAISGYLEPVRPSASSAGAAAAAAALASASAEVSFGLAEAAPAAFARFGAAMPAAVLYCRREVLASQGDLPVMPRPPAYADSVTASLGASWCAGPAGDAAMGDGGGGEWEWRSAEHLVLTARTGGLGGGGPQAGRYPPPSQSPGAAAAASLYGGARRPVSAGTIVSAASFGSKQAIQAQQHQHPHLPKERASEVSEAAEGSSAESLALDEFFGV